jgi:hypothetical protein
MLANKRYSKNIGASFVELAAGLLIAIPVFLFIFDCITVFIGTQFNEKVCRDAARFAASGPPKSAQQRAQNSVGDANVHKIGFVNSIEVVSVGNSLSDSEIMRASENGGTISGEVTVTTAVNMKPMCLKILSPKQKFLTVQCKQTFPYTYMAPNINIFNSNK